MLQDGFYHALGHGVGLEVHEEPTLGRAPGELVAGDVIAVEPGLYRHGYGGCRLEDLVLVTENGPEVLTDYPYDLAAVTQAQHVFTCSQRPAGYNDQVVADIAQRRPLGEGSPRGRQRRRLPWLFSRKSVPGRL